MTGAQKKPGLKHWTGKLKKVEQVDECLPLRWPQDVKGKWDLFWTWQRLAMQTHEKNRRILRILALLPRYFNTAKCQAWPSDERLADDLGCSRSTIQRPVSDLKRSGFIDCELRSRKDKNGQNTSYRVINFTVPKSLEPHVLLASDDEPMRQHVEATDPGKNTGPMRQPDDEPMRQHVEALLLKDQGR